jgi:hypothetical protein
VGLERGPLSLVSTIEELLGRKSSGSGLLSRKYGRRDASIPRDTFYTHKVVTNFAGKRLSLGRYRSIPATTTPATYLRFKIWPEGDQTI